MAEAFRRLGLNDEALFSQGRATEFANELHAYFQERARVLMEEVRPRLMDKDQARALFEEHSARLRPMCPIPMNKQKGDKRAAAYLTALVNMLIEENVGAAPVDYDPRKLTTFTANGVPLRTLSRRVDGAFPSTVNPIAIWEIKEYYYTETFGSRVADGVYETLLDGMELEELHESEGVPVEHLLIVDAYQTWWRDGKSYLCRMLDMLHMGYVTEVLFGSEVIERMPDIVRGWRQRYEEERSQAA